MMIPLGVIYRLCSVVLPWHRIYNSEPSIACTSFGPWKFVLELGSSSHWGLIIAQCQEANGDIRDVFSIFFEIMVC